MSQTILNLDDIQGNVTRAYGRFSFSHARYFFLHIKDPASGRAFIDKIRRYVTTAHRWDKATKPKVTLNIGFTFAGLAALKLPTRTLQGMPEEFIDGMKARAFILGDRSPERVSDDLGEWNKHWDPIWQDSRTSASAGEKDVHIWISMNAQGIEYTDKPDPALEEQTKLLRDICAELDENVCILGGIGQDGSQDFQDASAVFDQISDEVTIPTPKEHFGFSDGIGDPVFEGQYTKEAEAKNVVGRGKWLPDGNQWTPLAAGEFILGHADESQELPPTAMPANFMHNGTFMAFRKLHQNVGSFRAVLKEEAKRYASVMGVDEEEAEETLGAKMVGRWANGMPLSKVPTYAEMKALSREKGFDNPKPLEAAGARAKYLRSDEASNFKYGDDMEGFKCPVGSHLRRANTRDYLDPDNKVGAPNPKANTQLNNRRRILRRGLPYGAKRLGVGDDQSEQGVIFMTICANLFRQFEFIQQQWIEYGLDFNEGNNTCPLLGNHDRYKRHPIPSDPKDGKPPYIMSSLKTFVECRGGDYFFIPSITALRMMAMGIVDPT